MQVSLQLLQDKLASAPEEETVDSSAVNPYLLNDVLRPLLRGESLRYGDVDYSRFEADDIRALSYYCDCVERMKYRLQGLIGTISSVAPCACTARAFC